MDTKDITKLKKDNKYILSLIKQSGNSFITKENLSIIFPSKFIDREISILGNMCNILGIFSIVDWSNNKYGILTIPARINTQPVEINNIIINNKEYIELIYDKNTDIFTSINVLKENDFIFDLFELFLIQGKIPWYLEYEDIIQIFDKLKKYTGSKSGDNQLAYEILTAIIARWKKDKNIDYRLIANGKNLNEVDWIGLENIWYSFKSTLSKLAGSYMKLGEVSAILNPEKEISDLENIIRE